MTVPVETTGGVHLEADRSGAARVQLTGRVDGHSGGWLVELTEAAPGLGLRRLEVELTDVEGFDADGAVAVSRCRSLAGRHALTITFRARRGVGRELLLASLRA